VVGQVLPLAEIAALVDAGFDWAISCVPGQLAYVACHDSVGKLLTRVRT
jgi:hypothetical protein